MIKNLLDSVEENFNATIILMLFLGAILIASVCVLNDVRRDRHDIEMAKLGCSQELVEIHTIPHTNPYIIWKCGHDK